MTHSYEYMKTILIEKPTSTELQYLENKLMGYNGAVVEGYAYQNWLYKVMDHANDIVAGIHCQTGGGWLCIASLWVEKNFRKRGMGRKLLLQSEETAKEKGCQGSYLYTYSFQAPMFYEKEADLNRAHP